MHRLLDADWWQKVGPTLTAIIVPTLTMILSYLWLARRLADYQTRLNKGIEDYKIDLSTGLETHKMSLSKGLEDYKAVIGGKLDTLKRYSETQFRFYNELWGSLCDLRIAGNDLWEEASEDNLQTFAKQLKDTEDKIMKSRLLIEDWHYHRLDELMREFNDFSVGKNRVREFRKRQYHHSQEFHPITEQDIQRAIDMNRATKERYSMLLEEIQQRFKDQIRG